MTDLISMKNEYNKLNKSICQIIKESCIIWIVAISFCIVAITMI